MGVVRVLLADMSDMALINVHGDGGGEGDGRPSIALMERVLAGLQRI
ncbi:DUF742 domain-containing protein [Actinosynnema sp. NPDC050436]